MRKGWVLVAGYVALVAALAYAFRAALGALKSRGGIWSEAWRVLYGAPPTSQRTLIALSALLILTALLLTPIALAERRSQRAFDRKVEEVRAERPLDVATPYSGPEGEGVAFDREGGRILVLRGTQGVGAPVVVSAPTAPRQP